MAPPRCIAPITLAAKSKADGKNRVNLWACIYDAYKPTFYKTLFWVIGEHAMKICQPLLLSRLLSWIVENAAKESKSDVDVAGGVLLSVYMLIAR